MADIKPMKSSNKGGSSIEFELVPEGNYLARCYRTINEGSHKDEFPGQTFEAKMTERVIFYFELLQDYDTGEDIRMEDGRPFSINKKYTNSMHEKASLRKDIQKWTKVILSETEAEDFDLNTLLGKFCIIQVSHVPSKSDKNKFFANISAIMGTGRTLEGVNELSTWSVHEPDQAMFDTFSDYLKKRINESEELKNKPLAINDRPRKEDAPVAKPEPKKSSPSISDELDEQNF